MKKGNYLFHNSLFNFTVPIDVIVPSRSRSSLSVFNSSGYLLDHKNTVIVVLSGESLSIVVDLLDEYGNTVNTTLLKDYVVVNVISYENDIPVGFSHGVYL